MIMNVARYVRDYTLSWKHGAYSVSSRLLLCNDLDLTRYNSLVEFLAANYNTVALNDVLWIVCYSSEDRVSGIFELSCKDVREIVLRCMIIKASAFIVVRLSSNGDVLPADEDKSLMRRLRRICEWLNLQCLALLVIYDKDWRLCLA